jgi:hypothetical protein|tara:strand:- start:2204 stop:2968 length:765 start_codon:yes stop_codon:yes gene_type:complete
MKTFAQLRERLDEVNFKQDMKKNHISSTKIKNTEVHYHAEKKGSKKIRVFVKPKSAKEFEELGIFKDMNTAKKSAEQFVKLMGEDIDEGISLWKEFRVKAEDIVEVTDKEVTALKKLSKDMQSVLKGYQSIVKMGDKELKDSKYNKDYEAVLKARDVIFSLIGKVNTQKILNKEDYSLDEEVIVYKVKGIQKPEMDRFKQGGRMMGLKVSFQKKGSDTMVTMTGTKKKLRDFDSIARGKSSYGDASSVQHFDEK